MKTRQQHPQIRYCGLYMATQHALQGMVYLAKKPDNEFSLIENIAQTQELPKNFLGKIFQTLAHKGLVISQKGPGGGYVLAKPANEIFLSEIIDAAQEPATTRSRCFLGFADHGKDHFCAFHPFVAQADKIISDNLGKMTLSDLVSGGNRDESF